MMRKFAGNRWMQRPRALAALSLLALVLQSATAVSAPLPRLDGKVHLGVASCAFSGCHGAQHRMDAGDDLHWGYVGDLEYVNELLDEVVKFLGNEEG